MNEITKKLRNHIGNTIRARRKSLNLTAEQLSELIDISPSYLGLIERGSRGLSLPKLLKVSVILDCSIDELTGIAEFSHTFNSDNIHITRLIAHIRSNECENEEDIDFLISIMNAMSEHKKNRQNLCKG